MNARTRRFAAIVVATVGLIGAQTACDSKIDGRGPDPTPTIVEKAPVQGIYSRQDPLGGTEICLMACYNKQWQMLCTPQGGAMPANSRPVGSPQGRCAE